MIRMGNLIHPLTCGLCYCELINRNDRPPKGLFGPNHTEVSIEGLYFSFRLLDVYLPDLIEVVFETNISGRTISVYRCIRLSDIPSDITIDDIKTTLARATRRTMKVERDLGYLYLGRIIITIEGITYDLANYLEILISGRWIPPSPAVSTPSSLKDDNQPPQDPEFVDPEKFSIVELPIHPDKVESKITDPEYAVPLTPTGDESENVISKSIGELKILENVFTASESAEL